MDQIKLEELAVAYPDQEDLVQVYKEWGDSAYLQELFKVLDSYEPDWNKEKELGSWAAEFLLDILEEEEWEEMTPEERTDRFNELLDERYEDFRSSHQFARINNINLYLQEGEDLDAVLAEGDEKVMFPKLGLYGLGRMDIKKVHEKIFMDFIMIKLRFRSSEHRQLQ